MINPRKYFTNNRIAIFILLFTIFSGVARKWVFPQSVISDLLLVAQLCVPFAALLVKPLYLTKSTIGVLLVYLISLVVLAMNPLNHTYFHGLFGLIIHANFWIPMFILIENKDKQGTKHFLSAVFVVVLIELVLVIFQYNLPRDHVLNLFASGEENSFHAGDSLRVTGTFSHGGGYGAFVIFLGLVMWGASVQRKPTTVVMLYFILALVTALFSGSRAPISLFLLFSVFALFQYASKKTIVPLVISVLVIVVCVNYIEIPLLQRVITNSFSRFQTGLQTGESNSRLLSTILEVINYRGRFPVFGTGLGGTYQGAVLTWGESIYLKEYGFYEEDLERIVLEGGFFLLLFKFILSVLLFRRMHIPLGFKVFFVILINTFFSVTFLVFNIPFLVLGLNYLNISYREASLKRA